MKKYMGFMVEHLAAPFITMKRLKDHMQSEIQLLYHTRCGFVLGWMLTAIFFGAAMMFTPVMKTVQGGAHNLLLLPTGAMGFMLATVLLYYVSGSVARHSSPTYSDNDQRDQRLSLFCFTIITLVGIFYLLVYYPGTGMYDTIAIIKSKGVRFAVQHPWLYLVLVQKVVALVHWLGFGYEGAFVALALIQIVLIAGVCTHCLLWLRRKGVPRWLWLVIAAIYMTCPYLNLMMVNIFKDIPFSLVLILWIPLLYDAWESRGKVYAGGGSAIQILLLLFFALLRNNGIYVSGFIILSLFLCLPKTRRNLKLTGLSLGALLLVLITSFQVHKSYNIKPLFKETVGVPLQQLAATVCAEGQITPQQAAFLNQVIPLEFVKAHYNPYSADPLKWGGAPLNNHFLYEHKAEFLKVWAAILPHNLATYLDAYFRITYGYWSLDPQSGANSYTRLNAKAFETWLEENNVSPKSVFPAAFQHKLERLITPLTRSPIGNGTMFWILLLCCMVIWWRSGSQSLLFAAPIVGNWLTLMISAPIAYSFRYVYSLILALPLVVGIVFMNAIRHQRQNDVMTK